VTKAIERKRIVVCADDFGLTEAASQSIVQLASVNAISATSCVVDGEFAPLYANALLSAGSSFSIGLHFNLTESTASPLKGSLQSWLFRSFLLHTVNRQLVAQEAHRQLDLFERLFKRAPQFVDGHEHVHQFPIVRDAMLEVLLSRYAAHIAIRCTVPCSWRGVKAQIISGLGGQALQRRLIERDIYANADFAGVYNFTTAISYSQRMRVWLDSIADNGLLMCHPELPTSPDARPNARPHARHNEHQYFSSEVWMQQREAAAIKLVPFGRASVRPKSDST